MLNTDTFLKIGDSHRVCQDYIINGNSPVPFIILSDGCSSSNNTEMGARILCHLTKQFLGYRGDNLYDIDYYKMGNWIIHSAELVARQLGLTVSSLTATLIISFVIDNIVYIYMYGDGDIIAQDKNGKIQVCHIKFTNNAPYYLSYLIDEFRDEIYHENKNSKSLTWQYEDGSVVQNEIAYDAKVILKYDINKYPTIFICSDGIESFIKKDPSQKCVLSPHEILPDMMAFKNFKGEFLKRRIKKALINLESQGVTHYDDLSVGAYTRLK